MVHKSAVLHQALPLPFGKRAYRMILWISGNAVKISIRMILRCSCKIFQAETILDRDQKNPIRLQKPPYVVQKCFTRLISFRKTRCIFKHTI